MFSYVKFHISNKADIWIKINNNLTYKFYAVILKVYILIYNFIREFIKKQNIKSNQIID
jgi:hypothetical protein